MVCQSCPVCDKENCPKEFGDHRAMVQHIAVSQSTAENLAEVCKAKGFMQGEHYYQVPDYNRLLEYFLSKKPDDKLTSE